MRCPDQIQRQINQEEVFTACNRVALVISHVLEERNPRGGSLQKEKYRENSVSHPGRKEKGRQNRICACSHRPLPSSGDVCRDPAFSPPAASHNPSVPLQQRTILGSFQALPGLRLKSFLLTRPKPLIWSTLLPGNFTPLSFQPLSDRSHKAGSPLGLHLLTRLFSPLVAKTFTYLLPPARMEVQGRDPGCTPNA